MSRSLLRLGLLPLGGLLLLAPVGCGSDDPPSQEVLPADYHQDAKPLLERYCTTCHQPGGIGPFSLNDYASVKAQSNAIGAAVRSGSMPPWMPADDSLPLRYSRKMRDADRDLLLRWLDEGAVEGDATKPSRVDVPPAEQVAPPRPDLLADMGLSYEPNTKVTDDYRCFIIDPKLDSDVYVQATDVKPGNPATVHHVILFQVPEKDAARIRAKDTAEDGPGFTCFGGAGSNNAEMITGWAPGGVSNRLEADSAIQISKGSLLVMQVHYNMLRYQGGGDRTVATLELTKTKPAHLVHLIPIANPGQLKIAAGDAHASQVIAVPIALALSYLKLPQQDLTVIGNTPHMHLLGTRISTSVQDGPTMLEIPHWDFHWQQAYSFKQPFILHPSDTLVVECDYDNSVANQPVVNGERQTPRDVTWGEGTLDEMCLSFLHIRM